MFGQDDDKQAGGKAERADQERNGAAIFAVNREDERAHAVAPNDIFVSGGHSPTGNDALKSELIDKVQAESPPTSAAEAYSDAMVDKSHDHRDMDALDVISKPSSPSSGILPTMGVATTQSGPSLSRGAPSSRAAAEPEVASASPVSQVADKVGGLGDAISEVLAGLLGAGVSTGKSLARTVDTNDIAPPSANTGAMDHQFFRDKQATTPVLPRNPVKADPKA